MVLKTRTVLVGNLPPSSTIDDVEIYFRSSLPGCKVTVSPLVPLTIRKEIKVGEIVTEERRCTTVTFRGDDDWIKQLAGRLFNPKICQGDNCRDVILAFEEKFIGLSPIAQDLAATPRFHFIFIHGLGGHAFNTWRHENGTMWPRDLLCQGLHNRQLYGRYWTFGYDANKRDRDPHVVKTIQEASEQLLSCLQQAGFEDDPRPIYFACHSLGGLVLCNALNLVLRLRDCSGPERPQFQKVFMHGEECKVKGVIFFGTPFRGSIVANKALWFEGLERRYKYNVDLIRTLKAYSKEASNISMRFNQVEGMYGIEPIIYHENRRICSWRYVVSHHSARGAFTRTSKPLNADHIRMIKFAGAKDQIFETVFDDIHELVKKLPAEAPIVPQQTTGLTVPASHEAKEEKVSFEEGMEVYVQAMEEYANQLLSFVGRYKKAHKLSTETPRKVSGSKWRTRNPSISPPQDSTVPPRSPQAMAKKPVVTFGDIKHLMDQDAANTTNPPPPYQPAAKDFLIPLRDFHTVFILDDSGSMVHPIVEGQDSKSRWDLLVESLQYFGDVAAQSDEHGVDIKFLVNEHKNAENIQSGQQVLDILEEIRIRPDQGSLDSVLWGVLRQYLDLYRQYQTIQQIKLPGVKIQVETPRALNVIVITDGLEHDYEEVEAALIRTARELQELEIPKFQLGVQFVQVGKDTFAEKRLRLLDDKLAERYGVRDICDMRSFDTKEFERIQKQELVEKLKEVLLGSVTEDFQGFPKEELKPYWHGAAM